MSTKSANERRRCTGKNKASEPCGLRPVPGRDQCKFHGGRNLRGPAHGSFKHGRYSEFVPEYMLKRLQASANDPDLLSLRAEIAVVEQRVNELLQTLPNGAPVEWWQQLQKAWRSLRAAKDPAEARAHTQTIDTLIETGASAGVAWDAIYKAIHQRRRLVDSEMRRQVQLQQVVTLEQVGVLFEALRVSVAQHVKDPQAIKAIQSDLTRLLTFESRGA